MTRCRLLLRTSLLLLTMTMPALAAAPPKQTATRNVGPNRPKDRPEARPTKRIVYKSLDIEVRVTDRVRGKELGLHVFEPAGHKASDSRPAIVFFHGGVWHNGYPSQFFAECAYLAGRGMWAASAEYRLTAVQSLIPQKDACVTDCVADAQDAVRYIREHAKELGVDPQRIAAGGYSAGGHLAAATAVAPDESGQPPATVVSCKPNLLLLVSPALFAGMAQGTLKLEDFTEETPPTVQFYGTQDAMLDYGKPLGLQASKLGLHVETYTAENVNHGFFINDPPWRQRTLFEIDRFLARHGYVTGAPPLSLPDGMTFKQVSDFGSVGR